MANGRTYPCKYDQYEKHMFDGIDVRILHVVIAASSLPPVRVMVRVPRDRRAACADARDDKGRLPLPAAVESTGAAPARSTA